MGTRCHLQPVVLFAAIGSQRRALKKESVAAAADDDEATDGDVDLAARICRASLPRRWSIAFPHGHTAATNVWGVGDRRRKKDDSEE